MAYEDGEEEASKVLVKSLAHLPGQTFLTISGYLSVAISGNRGTTSDKHSNRTLEHLTFLSHKAASSP